ncbi:MAG: ABC transporter ATP-binding protein [Clostridiales bacterium]|nr:ABC transporter ATP-binding protein [Clostridiales bacterium]
MHDDNTRSRPTRGPGGGPHGPGPRGFEKPKNLKKGGMQLIRYASKYVPAIIVALTLAIGATVFHLIGPGKLRDITNLITSGFFLGVDLAAVGKIAGTLVAFYASSVVFSYAQSFIMATVTARISRKMRRDISVKINRLPLKYFDTHQYGDVLSRVTNDVDTIGHTLNQSLGSLTGAVSMVALSLVFMFIQNWIMALTAVGTTTIGFFLMMMIVMRSQKYFMRQQATLGEVNGHIEEIYTGHGVVTASNGQAAAKRTFDEINGKLHDSAWRSQFMSGLMMPLMQFIGNFGYAAVCVVGAALAMGGHIKFGTIVEFTIYVRLYSNQLSQFAQIVTNLQSTVAAGERVFDFLSEGEIADEREKVRRLDAVMGDVEFRHVKFGYSPDRTIIGDFSARIRAGQKVAIVGPTGAGKTTLVNLLMRFYELDAGEILVDGVPISELSRENVRALFGMVLQDTWLFEGTIRDNVVYDKRDASDEDVRRACRAVGIDHFIRTLPNGYDTVIDDKANLSAGQKQLLTIARAMIENAPLLILDEATSSVDTRTELQIQRAMDKLSLGRTSFVIAHRLSTIRNADLILVMRDGDIVESGTHAELLAAGGFYAELYNSQFEQAA